ncbi:uncharacterized protein LOC117671187 [Pantherophis guttatus]|uniref:Uncharacterized protein LOC117671187 n=1 Tax=Pantherophis guttatus TaxID=94885 RepID=A0A6P9CHW4_PANGU|nr:uncharacterized protein LOC117671187 [Pantherophis guttatus]
MDVRRDSWFLVIAWSLLDGPFSNGESQGTNGPCEQQLRFRHSSVESGGPWLSTLALLSSIGAIWLFVFYAIRCLCLRRNQCTQELDEGIEKRWEEVQTSCPEEDGDQSCGYQSQVLVPAQSEFGSKPPGTNPTLQAYSHQLACMEQELEHFLSEVRNRQGTLGGKAGKERDPPNLKKWSADKLRITVYEIADSEQPDQAWGRGRKRKFK